MTGTAESMNRHRRVVVVGGGPAGVSTAAALRAGGYEGRLTVVDRSELPYDRPPLSKAYLLGQLDLRAIALQPREWYAEQEIELVTNAEVARIRPGAEVEFADGRVLEADWIVQATGGTAIRPPVPGINSPRTHVLRDRHDADALGKQLTDGARLLVVGGGLIGAEIASTAVELGADVVLVDPLDPPIAGAVGLELATWLHGLHRSNGVETVATSLVALDETPTGIAARLAGEQGRRMFDVAVIGVGMRPATELAEDAGLATDSGIIVDAGQRTSHPKVLAVGDSARRQNRVRAEHWEAARLDGERAATTILGIEPPAESAPWFWTDRYGRHVEAVGDMRPTEAQERVLVRGAFGQARFSVWKLCGDRVVGCASVDDSTAVRAARRMIDRGNAVTPDQIADTTVDLRRLLRR